MRELLGFALFATLHSSLTLIAGLLTWRLVDDGAEHNGDT